MYIENTNSDEYNQLKSQDLEESYQFQSNENMIDSIYQNNSCNIQSSNSTFQSTANPSERIPFQTDYNIYSNSKSDDDKDSETAKNFYENSNEEVEEKQENDDDNYSVVRQNNLMEQKQLLNSKQIKLINKEFSVSLKNIRIRDKQQFYLMCDQIVNIDFLRNLTRNQQPQSDSQSQISVFKDIKFVNKVFHRIDNKFIEVDCEIIEQYLKSINPILRNIKTLGDINLLKFINNIMYMWNIRESVVKSIEHQSNSSLFQIHKQSRQLNCDKVFKDATSQIDQNKYIFYVYYKANYEKKSLDDCKSGYSPKLYELIAGNSYAFKEQLLKQGYIDPLFSESRLLRSYQNSQKKDSKYEERVKYANQQSRKDEPTDYKIDGIEIKLMTVDEFIIPAIVTAQCINLDKEYDQLNNLDFKVTNNLIINEFYIDQKIVEDLKHVRAGSKLDDFTGCWKFDNQANNYINQQDEITSQFLKNYYIDDIQHLIKRGSKWNKKCEFAEIPTKKQKQ